MAAHNTELAHKGTKIGEPLMHGNYDHDVDALFSDAMSVGKIVGVLDLKTRHQQTQRRPWTGWSHNRAWWFSNMTPCMMGATSMPSSPSWTRRLCRNRRHTAPAMTHFWHDESAPVCLTGQEDSNSGGGTCAKEPVPQAGLLHRWVDSHRGGATWFHHHFPRPATFSIMPSSSMPGQQW
jgi:hypothetical protein